MPELNAELKAELLAIGSVDVNESLLGETSTSSAGPGTGLKSLFFTAQSNFLVIESRTLFHIQKLFGRESLMKQIILFLTQLVVCNRDQSFAYLHPFFRPAIHKYPENTWKNQDSNKTIYRICSKFGGILTRH